MNNSPIIIVENLNYKFHDTPILVDVSFTIQAGSITTIIGPNGAGKSTLIKLIMGMLNPTSGKILIQGGSPKKQREMIGYVPQRFNLPIGIPMTVHEFLLFTTKKNTTDPTRLFEKKLNEVGLDDFQQKDINKLSGGQLQRVLIARVLLSEKKILILDEAISSVDIEGKLSIQQIINDLNEKLGITIILISHELEIVFKYTNNVICLNKRLLCNGVPAETITQEILDQMYGGKHNVHYHHSCSHEK